MLIAARVTRRPTSALVRNDDLLLAEWLSDRDPPAFPYAPYVLLLSPQLSRPMDATPRCIA